MVDAAHASRLAQRISKIVAELLERRIKDPRLGFVTVTEARLTPDLRDAKVFYTVLGSSEEREETAAALRSATGIIRSEVGRLPDSVKRIDDLVATALKADEELARAREGAQWAGDPDPYKKPAEDSGDEDDEDDEDEDD
jgi:ribosome-binding factor A